MLCVYPPERKRYGGLSSTRWGMAKCLGIGAKLEGLPLKE
jgi:hypothetical protein